MTRPAEVTTGGYVCDATDRTQALRIDQHGGKNLRPWSMTLRALTHTREAAQATALRLRCDTMTGHNNKSNMQQLPAETVMAQLTALARWLETETTDTMPMPAWNAANAVRNAVWSMSNPDMKLRDALADLADATDELDRERSAHYAVFLERAAYVDEMREGINQAAEALLATAAGLTGTDNDNAVCGLMGTVSGLLALHRNAYRYATNTADADDTADDDDMQ
jgi:hypothetical protein